MSVKFAKFEDALGHPVYVTPSVGIILTVWIGASGKERHTQVLMAGHELVVMEEIEVVRERLERV